MHVVEHQPHPPVPELPVSMSSVFPWTPSSQMMEPLENPGGGSRLLPAVRVL